MAHMPVATLRIWEQRYQAVHTQTTASGHRRYTPADVQRVLLLRHLTENGHAIGSIAALTLAQLQAMAEGADGHRAPPARAGSAAALQWLVVGPALAARLQRPAVLAPLSPRSPRMTVLDSLTDVTTAHAEPGAVDLLVWFAPELPSQLPPELQAAQQICRPRALVVVYRFASAAAIQAVTSLGAKVLREPADDVGLGQWLASTHAALGAAPRRRRKESAPGLDAKRALTTHAVAPRRFDDVALTAIAGAPPSLACECPRHIAELLMQLSSFEAYSADCSHRNTADQSLHQYLQQVAGTARVLFEAALERVARHEGLRLS